MEKEEYSKMYELELDYWWFKGKRFLVKIWLDKYFSNRKNLTILDVGCGTGMNMQLLEQYGLVYGLDASDDSLSFCKKRGLNNLAKASAENIPCKNDCFDIVTMLDVLYHKNIRDDNRALKEISRTLKKDGILIITDSAMKCLWSRHDIAVHAGRRYNKMELQKKLENTGFKIEKISYFNFLLFLPVFVSRKICNFAGAGPKSDIQKINPFLNTLIHKYYSFEVYLLKYLNYPWGISIFAIGKNKKTNQ